MDKISKFVVLSICVSAAGMMLSLVGCENPHIKKAGENIKDKQS